MPNLHPLPYYAGLIDGDGYIGMMSVSHTRVPTISLAMTHEETVKRFAEFFNITYDEITSPSFLKGQRDRGHKRQWRARACSHKAYDIIKQIQPWLLEKADAALECCKYYEGRVCQMCGGDVPTDRPGKASKYCSVKCYKTADRRRRKGNKIGIPHVPILESKEVLKPERIFSCEDEHLSYWGGIMDAEGHFGLHDVTWGQGMEATVQIKACFEPMMKEFSDYFNIPCRKLTAPSHLRDQEEKGHSQAYVIQNDSLEWAREFTEKLIPFLHTKKIAAEMVFQFTSKKKGSD